jgi:hypothetical protein
MIKSLSRVILIMPLPNFSARDSVTLGTRIAQRQTVAHLAVRRCHSQNTPWRLGAITPCLEQRQPEVVHLLILHHQIRILAIIAPTIYMFEGPARP